jgi:hypothetical protein
MMNKTRNIQERCDTFAEICPQHTLVSVKGFLDDIMLLLYFAELVVITSEYPNTEHCSPVLPTRTSHIHKTRKSSFQSKLKKKYLSS